MITDAQKQFFLKLKRSQYAYLRGLSDVGRVDLEDIEAIIVQIVRDRLKYNSPQKLDNVLKWIPT